MRKSKYAIRWIDKLEKTKMKQGTRYLGSSKIGYCCLGIGCEMFRIDFRGGQAVSHDFKEKVGLLSVNGTTGDQSTIRVKNRFDKPINSNCLTALNDFHVSFKDISKIIKENVCKFFEKEVCDEINEHYKK